MLNAFRILTPRTIRLTFPIPSPPPPLPLKLPVPPPLTVDAEVSEPREPRDATDAEPGAYVGADDDVDTCTAWGCGPRVDDPDATSEADREKLDGGVKFGRIRLPPVGGADTGVGVSPPETYPIPNPTPAAPSPSRSCWCHAACGSAWGSGTRSTYVVIVVVVVVVMH